MLDIISSQSVFFIALALFIIGAIGSLALGKKDRLANLWGNGFAIFGSVMGILASVKILFFSENFSTSFNSSFPLISFSFQLDNLAAFFVLVIALIALLASVYALGYVKHFYGKYNIGVLGFFYNIFIAGMLLVVTASNAVFFLIVWEIMSLASYFLVVFENKEKDNIQAGSLYFIMTHIGTAFILLAFLFLYQATGSLDFEIMKNNSGAIPLILKNIIFILALIGFGTKAGIIPLHIWLPSAHPAAPTHVSALMSGVMIKTGIYMMIRLFVDILPDTPLWWGFLILIIGAMSSLLGVLYALAEHDIKKLLAYHSIENIGIILLGLGSGLVFLSLGLPSLAILGLMAALFHTLNHATFKALLFLGAGAVISKTHTRNIEEYGGLIRYMPQTAFFFLIGSLAISALPPFNGFFSEWLTFQSLFYGIKSAGILGQGIFILAAGSLAFTGGLAAACFVKAFGATFLARPRSAKVKQASEVEFSMKLGMGAIALATLVLGILAPQVSQLLSGVAGSLGLLSNSDPIFSAQTYSFSLKDGFASISPAGILAALLVALSIVAILVYFKTKDRKIEIGRTWDCGTALNGRMEITATGFSRSIITIFSGILKPTKQNSIEYRDADMRYFQKANVVNLETKDVYRSYLYKPGQKLVVGISNYVKKIQGGNVNAYILYIFITLMVLIFLLVI